MATVRERGHGGFTIAEMLVVMALATVVMSAAASLMVGTSRVTRTERDRLHMHEASRVLLTLLGDDLRAAGASLDAIPGGEPVDCILLTDTPPTSRSDADTDQRDDAITIRRIDDAAWTHLGDDVAAADDEWLAVADTGLFTTGARIIVYDTTGDYDIRTVLDVDASPPRIQISSGGSPPPLMKAYTVADGTLIGLLTETVYAHDPATAQITRQVDGGQAVAIAAQVEDLTLTYFDGADPSDTFVPTDEAERKQIVRVRLELTTKGRLRAQLTRGDYRHSTAMTSIVLRNRTRS